MTDGGYGDFEFERRFLVRDLPEDLRDAPALIVQSYYLADEGYALRLRAKVPTCLLYTSPSPRDLSTSRMPSSA